MVVTTAKQLLKMKLLLPAALVSSILLLSAATSGAVTFDATNAASGTPGGQRFDQAVGVDYAKQVLSDASTFVWKTFYQPSPADRKPIDALTLVVDDSDGIVNSSNNTIKLSAQYIGGDVKTEVTSVLYHETARVWQWTGQGQAGDGLLEGIADFVRLRVGYAQGSWALPGRGDRWDRGFSVTAMFLDYCDSLKPGFVAELNAKLKDGYNDDYFDQILGKNVQNLWQDYVTKYQDDGTVLVGTTPSHNNSIGYVPRENGNSAYGTRDGISKHTSRKRLILSIVTPVAVSLCLISAIFVCALRKRRTRSTNKKLTCTTYSEDIEEIQAMLLDPLLVRASTDNFTEVNRLGEGGFRQVFKGLLPDGVEIAVKRLARESKQGNRELKNELLLLSNLQHRNLVKLIGACLHEDEKLLVYEYIPNRSLDVFIFDDEKRKQLAWETRYKIVCGIARGMMYLHDESRVEVIYRDLKPSNILLEKDM